MIKLKLDDKLRCANCILPIKHLPRIKCCECYTILCVTCFQFGIETEDHRRDHEYQVVDMDGEPLFEGAWSRDEEARLINAVPRFKMANWPETVKHMKSSRSGEEAAEYFDGRFVRGFLGEFGLAASEWSRSKSQRFSEGNALALLDKNCTSSLKYHLMLDALRALPEKDIPSTSSPDLKERLEQITKQYVDKKKTSNLESLPCSSKQEWILKKRLREVEELDPSSDEDGGVVELSKQVETINFVLPFDPKEFTPKNIRGSDDSDNESPFLPVKSLKRTFVRIRDPPISDSSNGHGNGDAPNEVASSVRAMQSQPSTSQQYEYNDDDRMESEDDLAALKAIFDTGREDFKSFLRGFTKDQSAYDPDQPSTSKCNGSAPASTIRGGRKMKKAVRSKKMSRLDAVKQKINSEDKKEQITEQELNELCPMSEIKSLRDKYPKLCLDVDADPKERPERREDDLIFLDYNALREEFEEEYFNEAEKLISHTSFVLPEDNNKAELVNNNINAAKIQYYNRVLSKRNACRRAIVEHDKITEYLDFMKAMMIEKRSATDIINDRSPEEKLKCTLQQTLTKEEHTELYDQVEKAKFLKEKILRLRELQKQGVTTLPDEEKVEYAPKNTTVELSKTDTTRMEAKWDVYRRKVKKEFGKKCINGL